MVGKPTVRHVVDGGPPGRPFVVFHDLAYARHVSNAMAIARLFGCGFALARYMGGRPLVVAMKFTAFGVAPTAATLVLGG